KAAAALLQRRHGLLGNVRLVWFVIMAVLTWSIVRNGTPSAWWLLAALIVFFTLGVIDGRIVRRLERAQRSTRFFERGLQRIRDDWSGLGPSGQEFKTPDHLYSEDLDILGEGSLFQLLCTARTRMGRKTLAGWLLAQDHPGSNETTEVLERQLAVAELRRKLALIEDLAVAGHDEEIHADPEYLREWSCPAGDEKRVQPRQQAWLAILSVLSFAALAWGLKGAFATGRGFFTPFIVLLVLNGFINYRWRQPMEKLFAGLEHSCRNLESLAELIRRIEAEQFESPLLLRIKAQLVGEQLSAAVAIAKLGTLCDLEGSRHNVFVRVFDLPVLYTVHTALMLERWRQRHGTHVPAWLDALGRLEALLSLATYSVEHPDDPFPELVDPGSAMFEGEALGHPLLPAGTCVRNSASLGAASRIMLVSGSNMSGKSTYLRAIGVNAVLAMCGAPVRARHLRLSPLAIGASIHISDSLQKGVSNFYAEITRIRNVVELSRNSPTLFLFDEVLQGTNSEDRHAGSSAVVRTLLKNGAIGLITTHDLALAEMEASFPGALRNVHFQESMSEGRLSFDYQLRPGVVRSRNGLELMKSIGLEV
ncbi:MAG TPA: hypothetical protein VE783_00690, partial [Candidatus Limnocylindrales bacterium]|nr:hypothetical protein [Candidatus Limnocylindrales bacterium]